VLAGKLREFTRDLPGLLLLIHESVRLIQEFFKASGLRQGAWNNPHAEGELIAPVRARVECRQLLSYSIHDGVDAVLGGIGNEDCKFISSEAGNDVGLTKGVTKHVRRVHESTISFLMPKGVVNFLHAVKIDECDQKRPSRSVCKLHVVFSKNKESLRRR
jgi:hypothetical protein